MNNNNKNVLLLTVHVHLNNYEYERTVNIRHTVCKYMNREVYNSRSGKSNSSQPI